MKSTAAYNNGVLIPLERFPTSYTTWNQEWAVMVEALREITGLLLPVPGLWRQPAFLNMLYLGCGRRLPDFDCLCCDVDPEVGKSNPLFFAGDAMNLPFPRGTFQMIVSSHTLEHLESAEQALQEQRRVTLVGGYLAHILPDKQWTGGSDPTHIKEWTQEEWLAEFGAPRGLQLMGAGVAKEHYSFYAIYQVKH